METQGLKEQMNERDDEIQICIDAKQNKKHKNLSEIHAIHDGPQMSFNDLKNKNIGISNKNNWTCDGCGNSNLENYKFCTQCGVKYIPPSPNAGLNIYIFVYMLNTLSIHIQMIKV